MNTVIYSYNEVLCASFPSGHVSEAQLRVMYEDMRPSTSRKAVNLLDALHQDEVSDMKMSANLFIS